ncbi:MAG: regulatory protein RecX [Bacillota bacterium]
MKTKNKFQKSNPLAKALKLLTIRPRTQKELTQRLLEIGYTKDEINPVVSRLINLGYLDDIKFMESWCYYRQHISPKSRWYVLRELSLKGISPDDLEAHFNRFYTEEEEWGCLKRLMEKKLAKLNMTENSLNEKDFRKIVSAFLRKGFQHQQIMDMISQLRPKYLDN